MSLGVVDFLSLGSCREWVLTVPMAILHAAFDESGKFVDHDVTSLCGWISPLQSWDRFAIQWQAALDRIGISELHTAEFVSLHGQYAHLRTIWGDEREVKISNALTEFVNVIRSSAGKGIGATIDTKHYRSMRDDFKKAIHESRNSHSIAFQEVLNQTVRVVEKYS